MVGKSTWKKLMPAWREPPNSKCSPLHHHELRARSAPWASCHLLWAVPGRFLWRGKMHFPAGASIRKCIDVWGCTRAAELSRWWECVKKHPQQMINDDHHLQVILWLNAVQQVTSDCFTLACCKYLNLICKLFFNLNKVWRTQYKWTPIRKQLADS